MHDNHGRVVRGLSAALLGVWTLAFSVANCPPAAAVGLYAPAGESAGAPGDDGPEPEENADPVGSGPGMGGAPVPNWPRNATYMDQSGYAMGSMTWNVIMLESSGAIDINQENWTAGEISTLQTEINQAKSFWEGLTTGFHPGARLSIDIHYANGGVPIATPYEPIRRSSSQEGLWINSAMNALGYFNGDHFEKVRGYNNDRRTADGNHWATTIFIVDDTVDADNRFSNGAFAYAYFNGPFTMLTQGNNGWDADNDLSNFNMILSHEMGHIFGALDEYPQSGVRNTQRAGYLNGQTLNASLDGNGISVVPPQPNALMLNNGNQFTGVNYLPHSSALVNFGLRDADGDTIPDILDTPATLTGNAAGSDPNLGEFVFSGSISVNDYNNANPLNVGFSNSQADMTINTIAGMAYSLDGGLPVPFAPLDAAYDDYTEALGFSILGLRHGLHTIDVVGIDSVSNPSNVLHFEFSSVPEPSAMLLAFIAMIALANMRRAR